MPHVLGRVNVVNMSLLSKVSHRFNANLNKTFGFPWQLSQYMVHLQCRRPWFDSWVRKMPWRRDKLLTPIFLGYPQGSVGRESACNVENWVRSLGWEDPLEKEIATHSNILAWRTPWSPKRLSDFHFHFQIRHLGVCVFLLFSFLIFIIVQ